MRCLAVGVLAIGLALSGCGGDKKNSSADTQGAKAPGTKPNSSGTTANKYEYVDTLTDGSKQEVCKQKADDILLKLRGDADKLCLVGLWAYNPPAMLAALKDAKLEGKVRLVAFDEDADTLQGIEDGDIHGTIVQQPYMFGYESVRRLAAVIRGDKSLLPANGLLLVPHRVITKENVAAFRKELDQLRAGGAAAKPNAAAGERVKIGFVTNNSYEFWTFAQRGAEKAAAEFNVELEFHRPPMGTAVEQKQIIEDLLAKGIQGLAISVNDPENSQAFLDGVAEKVPLFTQDNDLPAGSKRLCYVGTDNITAGKAAGELVQKAMPDGGKVVIFVGKLDAQNAQERRGGVLETLKIPAP